MRTEGFGAQWCITYLYIKLLTKLYFNLIFYANKLMLNNLLAFCFIRIINKIRGIMVI